MKFGNQLRRHDDAEELPAERILKRHSLATYTDRMVPSRRSIETILRRNSSLVKASPKLKTDPYERYLSEEMQRELNPTENIRKMMTKRPCTPINQEPIIKPYRTIRVDGWNNEFYASLLDWSYNNYIGIGNRNSVDILNPYNEGSHLQRSVNCIGSNFASEVSSLAFSPNSTKYIAGLSSGSIHIVDYVSKKEVLQIEVNNQRIGSLEWKDVIFYGGRNCEVHALDLRSPSSSLGVLHKGQSEVCGIKQHGNLVAIGSNNNSVSIYDLRKNNEIDKYHHMACVKALCWDRSGEYLYSGGGCTDRRILKWSAKEAAIVAGVTTDSQVCNLVHSKNSNEIVGCFGYPLNEICVWNSQLTKVSTFRNSKRGRVLYAAINQLGDKVITGNGYGDLEFWRPFTLEKDILALEDCR